jgi:hypothetical protein
MGNFLDDLKKAVEKGEFNSDAAKKINDINELANQKGNAGALLEKRLETAGIKTASEEEATLANTEYENQMIMLKKQDDYNKLVVTLIEIEDMVKMSINDMFSHIIELESKFEKEFENKDPMFVDLYQKINEIKSKYDKLNNI